jgi:uncharacterized protein YkwD
MFKKAWKQFKILVIIIVVLICLPRSILPHQTRDLSKNDYDNYLKLNESELRLKEFKDNEEALKIKLIQLGIINKSRKRNDALPVKLDILASRVANKMCLEAARNNYIGHWNLAGEKPYHRYALAGGYDHVSENAFGQWSSDNYDPSFANISSMMQSGHDTFMSERSPNNGHKKTIIDKSHNFVGIGFNLSGKQFRYYEEFIDRYFEFENIPVEARVDEPTSITVKTKGENYLYYLIVYREEFPSAMTPAQITKKGGYEDYAGEEYLKIAAWDLSSYRSGTSYKIPLTFSKEGLYYIQIYYDKNEITKPSSLNTKGKTPSSGIVIKVKN